MTGMHASLSFLPMYSARTGAAVVENTFLSRNKSERRVSGPLRDSIATLLYGGTMQRWASPIKLFAYLVVLLMLLAICYAGYTAVKYWPAISV